MLYVTGGQGQETRAVYNETTLDEEVVQFHYRRLRLRAFVRTVTRPICSL